MDNQALGIALVAAAILLALDGIAGLLGSAWKTKLATQWIRVIIGFIIAILGALLIYIWS